MKIAFIAPEHFPIPAIKGGAVEDWIEDVSHRLKAHKITILSIYDPSLPISEKKGHITYLHFKLNLFYKIILSTYKLPFKQDNSFLYYLPYSLWCALKLKKFYPDIVHIHNRPHFIWIIRLFNPRAKIILHIHQVSALMNSYIWTNKLLKEVDLFLGPSKFIANEIKKRFPDIKERVDFIYNGIDIEEFKPVWEQLQMREELRKRFNLNGHKVILYSGRLAENKGVHILIKAFGNVLKSGKDKIKLFICGGRTYSDNTINQYIASLHKLASNIKETTVFTGYVPREEMKKYYLLSDLVVIPSIVEEGFCIVTIESMASGIPVIANAKGAITEIIKNKDNGILISDMDSEKLEMEIKSFLEQNERFVTYSLNARSFVEKNFNWDSISNKLETIYTRITKYA